MNTASTFYGERFRGIDGATVLQFLSLLAYCEQAHIRARKSQELAVIPSVTMYNHYAEERIGKVRAWFSVQGWDDNTGTMHTLITFPVTRSWNATPAFLPGDEGGERHLWGFVGHPADEPGLFTVDEATDLLPGIFEAGAAMLQSWLNLHREPSK